MELTLTQPAFSETRQLANVERASSSHRLEPLRYIDAGVLNIAYYEEGPAKGPVAILLHGVPGNEQNLDLAQAIRRAGWTVVTLMS